MLDENQEHERNSRKRKKRLKVIVEHHDDGEGNWLVSYSDMMTLLFCFFVMITAFSSPDVQKIERLKQATSKSMGGNYNKPFEDLSMSIDKIVKEIKLEKDVNVVETEEGVMITSRGTLFFDSGSAVLRPQAENLISHLTEVLVKQAQGFRVIVEGHTDDAPISSKFYPSNWELSSARAGTVVRLLEEKGFARKNMRPLGLADTEPLLPNRNADGEPNPANQAENRRIVIKLQKNLSP